MKKNEALKTQSLFLATSSRNQTEKLYPTQGILLALEALPKSISKPERPYVPEAEEVLYEAVYTLNKRSVLVGHENSVYYAAFSPDGQYIVTTSKDNTARLWNANEAGKQLAILEGHKGSIVYAAFSPDGKQVVTLSNDKTARIWDVNTGKLHNELTGHEDKVWHAAFSPDGQHLVTASTDSTARIWDVKTGDQLLILKRT